MFARKLVAASALALMAVTGFAGTAHAGGSNPNAPGPCSQNPESMPEYCNPPEPGTPGVHEPKPGGGNPDWFTMPEGDGIDAEATKPSGQLPVGTEAHRPAAREHILLARQVGVR